MRSREPLEEKAARNIVNNYSKEQLEQLKRTLPDYIYAPIGKVINKQNKEAEDRHNNHPMTDDYVSMPRYRVSLKGRYGKNNPNYCSWRGNNGSVPLEHAERVDVYIHRSYAW